MTFYRWFFILSVWLTLGGCATQPDKSSPFDVFEGESGAQLSELAQLTILIEQFKRLHNEVEELQFNTEGNNLRQQNLFQDIDRRLIRLERMQRLSGSPLAGDWAVTIPGFATGDLSGNANLALGGDGNVAADGGNAELDYAAEVIKTVSVEEQQAYDLAFSLLKQSKYQDAIDQFQKLVDTWPKSQLADDSVYWQAEAHYVNREAEVALNGFRAVLSRYPKSTRVPEALLKVGYIHYDIGAYEEAAKIFREVLERFPDQQVAIAAQTRLRRIEQTIQ